jgi:hypothetical protein
LANGKIAIEVWLSDAKDVFPLPSKKLLVYNSPSIVSISTEFALHEERIYTQHERVIEKPDELQHGNLDR